MKGADSAGGLQQAARNGQQIAVLRNVCCPSLPAARCRLSYWIVIVTNEARRFMARPSAVLLSAFGRSSP